MLDKCHASVSNIDMDTALTLKCMCFIGNEHEHRKIHRVTFSSPKYISSSYKVNITTKYLLTTSHSFTGHGLEKRMQMVR